jgi:hypothetical protein
VDSNFDKLHQGIPHGDIRPAKDKLAKGDISGKMPGNPETLKLEVNAMTSFMTEKAWAFAKNQINSNPQRFIRRELENDPISHSIRLVPKEITEEKLLDLLNGSRENAASAGRTLADITHATIAEQINLWQEQKLKERQLGNEDPIFRRYEKLLKAKDAAETNTPSLEIKRGIGTASETMWLVLSAIPGVYRKQLGKPITEEQYKVISRRAISLIFKIAQLQVNVFSELRVAYTREIPELPPITYPIEASFKIMGEDNNLTLALTDKVFEAAQNVEPRINLRTGCPAIFSQGPSGKNVITEMYEWVLELNDKYFLPNLEKYNRNMRLS